MKPKVIFIDSVHPVLFDRLSEAGYDCQWVYEKNREEIIALLHNCTGAVIRSKFRFDKAVFEAAPQLRWVARSGAGMENIDLETARLRKVVCFNSPEGNRDAVAEHAIGMLLSLFNNLNRADKEVRSGEWNREKNRGIELKGKTVGILGYGFMGAAFAERLKGFGVTVIAYDKYKSNFGNADVEEVSLEVLFKRTDVLSIHLPLSEETRFMVDGSFIDRFQKNIFLVNTARGKNLRTEDLLDRLQRGKVLGACLDVLEYEQVSFEHLKKEEAVPAFKRLCESDKVILSPHVAGWTHESYLKLSDFLADKILKHYNPSSPSNTSLLL